MGIFSEFWRHILSERRLVAVSVSFGLLVGFLPAVLLVREQSCRNVPEPAPQSVDLSTPPPGSQAVIRVYYATDRKPLPKMIYGGDRNADATAPINYGSCDVSIPRSHRTSHVERPFSLWRLEFPEVTSEHLVILKRSLQTSDGFYSELKTTLAAASSNEVLVFIHGYNVTFDDAVFRTAQIAFDLDYPGVTVLYSWPSKGNPAAYVQDLSSNEWSAQNLATFLKDLHYRTGAKSINVLAHSMGNRALVSALRMLGQGSGPYFNQVMLTAPDVDLGTFRQIATVIPTMANRVTLYASSNDEALRASKHMNGYVRLGDSEPRIAIFNHIDSVDATAVDTGFVGHSYYADNRSVLTDIHSLLMENDSPEKRFGISARGTPPERWWVFRP